MLTRNLSGTCYYNSLVWTPSPTEYREKIGLDTLWEFKLWSKGTRMPLWYHDAFVGSGSMLLWRVVGGIHPSQQLSVFLWPGGKNWSPYGGCTPRRIRGAVQWLGPPCSSLRIYLEAASTFNDHGAATWQLIKQWRPHWPLHNDTTSGPPLDEAFFR